MDGVYEKQDRFEILAVLREAFKKNSRIEISCNKGIVISRLCKIDLDGLTIPYDKKIINGNQTLHFSIQNNISKIEFRTPTIQLSPAENEGALHLPMPQKINITQRRKDLRIDVLEDYNFFCHGRFKNGEPYKMQIKNISKGGCALIIPKIVDYPALNGSILKNTVLDFDSYGKIPTDIFIINIKEISEIDINNQKKTYLHLACNFRSISHIERELDDMLMNLILNQKKQNKWYKYHSIC